MVTVLVAFGGLGGAATPASASPAWALSNAATPPGPPGSALSAVACATAKACLAIGVDQTYIPEFVAERWDGAAWQMAPIETPSGFTGTGLTDLACTSSSNCFAVGSTGSPDRTPLMERWDGARWSVVAALKPPGATDAWLTDVSCRGTNFCLAIGNFNDTFSIAAYSMRWNGNSWAFLGIAHPKLSYRELNALSCTSKSSCFAVGRHRSEDKTLVERWNGTNWSIVMSPAPSGTHEPRLVDVSCSTPASCIAVGVHTLSSGRALAFAERWNGAKWSLLTTHTPSGTRNAVLGSVSCVSGTDCFAVGSILAPDRSGTWIQHWNGAKWTAVDHPGVVSNGGFSGISCVTGSACFAVGGYDIATPYNDLTMFNSFALVERWNGTTWSISGPPASGSQSELQQVSCATASFCIAVGATANRERRTLIEHWNGATWAVFPSPSIAGAIDSGLDGVSCTSSTSCVAVGSYTTSKSAAAFTPLSLVERWDGTKWSIATGPTGVAGAFHAVSCPSGTGCFAVGTLIAQWNGSSVTISKNAPGGILYGVSCSTGTNCFAVGNGNNSTLVLRWNGTSWSTVAHPKPPPKGLSYFFGVSCATDGTCFAVGFADTVGGLLPLVERWNGTTWSTTPTPAVTGVRFFVQGVSCVTSTNCVAVGTSTGGARTVIEQWNGSTWEIATSPNRTDVIGNGLTRVSCATDGTCFAVGSTFTNQHTFPLIERYI